jgi:hypothetical protein
MDPDWFRDIDFDYQDNDDLLRSRLIIACTELHDPETTRIWISHLLKYMVISDTTLFDLIKDTVHILLSKHLGMHFTTPFSCTPESIESRILQCGISTNHARHVITEPGMMGKLLECVNSPHLLTVHHLAMRLMLALSATCSSFTGSYEFDTIVLLSNPKEIVASIWNSPSVLKFELLGNMANTILSRTDVWFDFAFQLRDGIQSILCASVCEGVPIDSSLSHYLLLGSKCNYAIRRMSGVIEDAKALIMHPMFWEESAAVLSASVPDYQLEAILPSRLRKYCAFLTFASQFNNSFRQMASVVDILNHGTYDNVLEIANTLVFILNLLCKSQPSIPGFKCLLKSTLTAICKVATLSPGILLDDSYIERLITIMNKRGIDYVRRHVCQMLHTFVYIIRTFLSASDISLLQCEMMYTLSNRDLDRETYFCAVNILYTLVIEFGADQLCALSLCSSAMITIILMTHSKLPIETQLIATALFELLKPSWCTIEIAQSIVVVNALPTNICRVDCSICMVDEVSNVHTLPCAHQFHEECIKTWLMRGNHRCPMCRDDSFTAIFNKHPALCL